MGFGLLLAVVLRVTQARIPIAGIILFTASRTAWLAVLSTRLGFLSTRVNILILTAIILLPIPIVASYHDFLGSLDGSLATKVDTILPLILGSYSTHDLLFGLGKINVKEFAEGVLERRVHVGHTLPGNIQQYGVISPLSYLWYTAAFLPDRYKSYYLTYVLVAGMTGLYPFAYLPLLLLVARAAIKSEEHKCLIS